MNLVEALVGVVEILLPAIGAGAGYYLLKGKKKLGNLSGTEALIVGAIVGSAALAYITMRPTTLYPGRLRNSGAYAPLVVTGRQPSGSVIF
jgi:hypothetical protein